MKSNLKTTMRKDYLLKFCLLFVAVAAGFFWISADNHVYAITLEESIAKALTSSDQAKVIEEGRNYSNAEADKVDTFTRPRIDTVVKYHELGTTADDSPFMVTPDRQIATGVTATHLLWAGGRISESRELKKNLKGLGQLQESSMKRDLAKQVSNAFVAVLYQQARLDVLQDRVKQRTDELSDATDLFEAGMVTNLDVREAKLQLHVAKDDLRSGESQFHTALVDFNLTLGEGGDNTLFSPEGLLVRPQGLGDNLIKLETLYNEKRQLDIKKAAEAVNISVRSLNIAKDEVKPALSLIAGTEYGGDKFSGMEASWNVGAQLTWNFYDGGTIDAGIAAARAQQNSSKATLNQAQKSISGALNKLRAEVESLDRRIALQQETVSLSNGNYEDARGLYLTGTMTLTRLGDFNLLYAEARFNLLQLYYLENVISIEISSLID
ncbi:MAG: TolC family protein [Desulfamplus sp.]|nr:TolC family protein [Desulfamplus sp.]